MTDTAFILDALREAVSPRPVRWASAETSLGDYEGRAATIEIFDVPAWEQRAVLAALRPQREQARQRLGEELRLVFHTPEATTRHYSHLRPSGYALDIHAPLAIDLEPCLTAGAIIDEDPLIAIGSPRRKVA